MLVALVTQVDNNMNNLREIFQPQIQTNPPITIEILEQVEFKRVWSGRMISVGDRVLYALVEEPQGEVIMSLIDSEIEEISTRFEFVDMKNDTLPILKKKQWVD